MKCLTRKTDVSRTSDLKQKPRSTFEKHVAGGVRFEAGKTQSNKQPMKSDHIRF